MEAAKKVWKLNYRLSAVRAGFATWRAGRGTAPSPRPAAHQICPAPPCATRRTSARPCSERARSQSLLARTRDVCRMYRKWCEIF